MKSKQSLITELKKIFQKELKIKINQKSKIYDSEKWDSVGNFNLLLSIEKKFKINFNAQEFNTLNSYEDILKIVKKKIK